MNRQHAREGGFSLVELLIAFFVLLFGILAVLVLFPVGMRESKQMVDASSAALVCRTARGLMETHAFNYHGDGQARTGFGTASMIQAKFGPVASPGSWDSNNFPVMFPWDLLGGGDDPAFPLTQRPLDDPSNASSHRSRVVDAANPQFSWDARFCIGRGIGETPPANFDKIVGSSSYSQTQWQQAYWYWFSQYFKYYAVQISIYRNYKEIPVPPGTIVVAAKKQSDGTDYAGTDPNRPLYSELVLALQPPADLMVGSAIRIMDRVAGAQEPSDWYKVTAISFQGGAWRFQLDRPYAGIVNKLGQSVQYSEQRNNIIATNSLVDSYTTILQSQLDTVDTSTLSCP